MKVYRYAENPYKPSTWNTRATGGNNIDANGEGVFCFYLGGEITRFFGGEQVTEEFDMNNLIEQFGEVAFGGPLHEIEVDEDEVVSYGYGRYANTRSNDYGDFAYVPECYVVFKEW